MKLTAYLALLLTPVLSYPAQPAQTASQPAAPVIEFAPAPASWADLHPYEMVEKLWSQLKEKYPQGISYSAWDDIKVILKDFSAFNQHLAYAMLFADHQDPKAEESEFGEWLARAQLTDSEKNTILRTNSTNHANRTFACTKAIERLKKERTNCEGQVCVVTQVPKVIAKLIACYAQPISYGATWNEASSAMDGWTKGPLCVQILNNMNFGNIWKKTLYPSMVETNLHELIAVDGPESTWRCSYFRFDKVSEALLKKAHINIEVDDAGDESPLASCVQRKASIPCLLVLLNAGAKVDTRMKNMTEGLGHLSYNRLCTPLQYAAASVNRPCIELLIEAGADETVRAYNRTSLACLPRCADIEDNIANGLARRVQRQANIVQQFALMQNQLPQLGQNNQLINDYIGMRFTAAPPVPLTHFGGPLTEVEKRKLAKQ